MSTTHYEFPTINGTDAINGVDAINGLANAVDTALYAVDSTVSGQSTDIATALSNAAAASSAATAASTNAAAAQATANSAVNTAGAANTTADNTASALNAFEQLFNLSPVSVSSGISATGFTYSLTLAQDTTGSIYKFYGHFVNAAGTAGSVTRVAIPGGTGDYTYGVATGLTLNQAPSTAYQVVPAGFRAQTSSAGAVSSLTGCSFAVGTNGQIYIATQSSSSGSISTSDRNAFYFFPCIYFNTSFGDDGE